MIEIILANKGLQGKIRLKRCPRRTDANDFRSFYKIRNYVQDTLPVCGPVIHFRLADTVFCIDKFISEPSAIAEKVTVHFAVVPVADHPQRTIAFTGNGIASNTAVLTDGRRHGQIPLACIMLLECFIGKYARRTDFSKVATELT